MDCLQEIDKILEEKSGYKEFKKKLNEGINQSDIYLNEEEYGRYTYKYLKHMALIEDYTWYSDNEVLILDDDTPNLFQKIIEGKIDVSEVRRLRIDGLHKYLSTAQEVKLFFSKFLSIRTLDLGETELESIFDMTPDLLVRILGNPNLTKIEIGEIKFDEIPGMCPNHIIRILLNKDLKYFNFGRTKFQNIPGITANELIKIFVMKKVGLHYSGTSWYDNVPGITDEIKNAIYKVQKGSYSDLEKIAKERGFIV